MSDSVRVARMRLHRTRNGSSDGHAAVRALDLVPSAPDRSVLVIRRLSLPAADPRTARERIAALLRGAARPALGPVAPDCAAVLFSDEVEAMSCLTADLVTGRAADRWYWPSAIRTGPAGTGSTLARLWLDRPSWVPATLAHLARRSPSDAVRAVGLLSGAQARAVLDTVLAAFREPVLSPVPATGPEEASTTAPTTEPGRLLALPSHWAGGGADLPPVGRALLTLGLTLAVTPSAARSSRLGREIDDLLRSANTPRPATGNRPTVADPRPAVPDHVGIRSADAPADTRRPATSEVGPEPEPEPEPTRRRWDGWGTAVESRFATLFYAVNLMTWLDLPRVDGPEPESGWAVLEALARSLLPTGPTTEQQDPIWGILAELDGRDPPTPTPVRLGALTHQLNGLLDRHRLAPEVFAQPGTLVVGRTHIDVVLGLHQIDLAARSCGLDQDPGWVPALGRIIAFHFDGGS